MQKRGRFLKGQGIRMAAPVFEEFEPANGCCCRGRVGPWRPAAAGPGAVLALMLVAVAAGALLGPQAVAATPAPGPGAARHGSVRALSAFAGGTPQGAPGPLFGEEGDGAAEPHTITRNEIVERAATWVDAKVPYDMNAYWSDGYRQDCSGFVSMAWDLGTNEWTGSLAGFADRISKNTLAPGDILLFHNAQNPVKGSHATIFGGWQDDSHKRYLAYELTPPNARKRDTPYAYWSNSSRYVPYRYKHVAAGQDTDPGADPDADRDPGADPGTGAEPGTGTDPGADAGPGTGTDPEADANRGTGTDPETDAGPGTGADPGTDADPGRGRPAADTGPAPFPGAASFGPGGGSPGVTRLRRMLSERGGARFYAAGPGSRWSTEDRHATRAFQRAQGRRGTEADGVDGTPGPGTWRLPVRHEDRDIPPGDPRTARGPGGVGPAGARAAGPGGTEARRSAGPHTVGRR